MIVQAVASLVVLLAILATIAFLAFDALQRRRETLLERKLSRGVEAELSRDFDEYGAPEGLLGGSLGDRGKN